MIDDDGNGWMAAARLIELLSMLPADSRVSVDKSGNLVARNVGGCVIAYISFVEGSLWWYAGDGGFDEDRS